MLVNTGTVFQKAGENGSMFEQLPAGHYKYIPATPMSPPMFKQLSSPNVPEKIYGNKPEEIKRVVTTIIDRAGRNTGVMAVGEKGSGKTMFLNQVNNRLADCGYPIIHVDAAMPGSMLNEICALAERNVVFFIDEFEKLYDEAENKKAQESLLTAMDGGTYSGNVFLLSANLMKVNAYMTDRPNRIHYTFKYESLPMDVLMEYLEDHLTDKSKVQHFVTLHQNSRMNFDIMQNLVQEVNRFPGMSFSKIVTDMNLTIEVVGAPNYYSVGKLTINGYDILSKNDCTTSIRSRAIQNRDMDFGDKSFKSFVNFDANKLRNAVVKSGIDFDVLDEMTDNYDENADRAALSFEELYADSDDKGDYHYGRIAFTVFAMKENSDGSVEMEGDLNGIKFNCLANPYVSRTTVDSLFKNM